MSTGSFICGVIVSVGNGWWGRSLFEFDPSEPDAESGFDLNKIEVRQRPAGSKIAEPVLVVHYKQNDPNGVTVCRTKPTPACSKPLNLARKWKLGLDADGELTYEDGGGVASKIDFAPDK